MGNDFQKHSHRPSGITIAALLGLALLAVVAALNAAPQISQQLTILRSAAADNHQWGLAQVEVDILQMQNAALRANDSGNLENFRRRYDIFYSRVKLLSDGSEFETVRTLDNIGPEIKILSDFLVTSVPVVDGDDAALLAALPTMIKTLDDLRVVARNASLAGVAAFGAIADEKREKFLAILRETALIALVIVLAMIALTFVLIRQVRISHRRGEEIHQKNIRLDAAIDASMTAERAKSRFLAVMSHEMRTPLNGLIGTLELLAGSNLSEKQQKHLNMAQSSSEILLHHVNDVLDISKIESDHLTLSQDSLNPANLLQEICDTNQALAAERGNTLDLVIPKDEVPRVTGDSMYLRQILLNLVGNAIKFTRDGQIALELQVVDQDSENIAFEFRVIDTGLGIASEDIDRVFDDFITLDSSYDRKVGGTGLGLGICHRLATAMGGEIGVESVEGDGSVFWLRLQFPICRAAPNVGELREAPHATERNLKILVAEDNATNFAILSEVLEADGHHVTHAANGQEAVEAARDTQFDLILMDISMPLLDGVAATRAILAHENGSPSPPIFALTAHASPNEQQRFLDAGMRGCLIKPIRRKDILALINKVASQGNDHEQSETMIDTELLQELHDALGATKYNTLRNRFLNEISVAMENLISKCEASGGVVENVSDHDLEGFRAELHQLSGAAANFGASTFRTDVIALERLCGADQNVDIAKHLNRIAERWTRSKAQIEMVQLE